jgi:hypothetical protein
MMSRFTPGGGSTAIIWNSYSFGSMQELTHEEGELGIVPQW